MRYYFNFIDGITTLDQDGCEFADLAGAKAEAVKACADLFRGPFSQEFWDGEPWKLWVTDQADGGGDTVFTLTFTAS